MTLIYVWIIKTNFILIKVWINKEKRLNFIVLKFCIIK